MCTSLMQMQGSSGAAHHRKSSMVSKRQELVSFSLFFFPFDPYFYTSFVTNDVIWTLVVSEKKAAKILY